MGLEGGSGGTEAGDEAFSVKRLKVCVTKWQGGDKVVWISMVMKRKRAG